MPSKSRRKLRTLLSLTGIFALLATVALGAATMRSTEATWQDTVTGESRFGTDENAGRNYARALASYGTMTRWLSGTENRGPSKAAVSSSDSLVRFEDPQKVVRSPFGRAVLPVTTEAQSCARAMVTSEGCSPEPEKRPNSYAVAEFHSLNIHALRVLGIPSTRLATYDADEPIRATASCTPGADGVAAVTAGGAVGLGGRLLDERVDVPVPLQPGVSRLVTRDWGAYEYQARIFNDRVTKKNHAISQIRLVIESTAWDEDGERWALNLILARAECGIAMPMPAEPPRPSTPTTPLRQTMMLQAEAPADLQPITEAAEAEALVDAAAEPGEADNSNASGDANQDETELPSLPLVDTTGKQASEDSVTGDWRDEEGEVVVVDTTTAATTPGTSTPTEPTATESSEAETSESETSDSVPRTSGPATTTVPAATEPGDAVSTNSDPAESTTPTKSTTAPQAPQDVSVGRWFSITGPGGAELGRAKLENVTRTAACGVQLSLSITTSDEAGSDRWPSIGPEDFAEVGPGGSTSDVQPVSADCEQAPDSGSTALSPDSDYEIVIAFHLSDSATRAMWRPEGTAGWIFDLPTPTTTSAATTTPTTTAAATTTTTAEA